MLGHPLTAQQASDLETLLFQLEQSLVCQLLTDSQGYLPRAGSHLGKLIFHINTALEVHYEFYFTRPNVFSFGPSDIPQRIGGRTNTETHMIDPKAQVQGQLNLGEGSFFNSQFRTFSARSAHKAIMG
jgi:hypothetical protein